MLKQKKYLSNKKIVKNFKDSMKGISRTTVANYQHDLKTCVNASKPFLRPIRVTKGLILQRPGFIHMKNIGRKFYGRTNRLFTGSIQIETFIVEESGGGAVRQQP